MSNHMHVSLVNRLLAVALDEGLRIHDPDGVGWAKWWTPTPFPCRGMRWALCGAAGGVAGGTAVAYWFNHTQQNERWRRLPKRVILVRHGLSEANINPTLYGVLGDVHVPLAAQGWHEAEAAGKVVKVGRSKLRLVSNSAQ
jgi:hypothetical protein